MTAPAPQPTAGHSAKALLLTMLGEFVLPRGGSVWTSTIVDSLARFGISERNARQAAARIAADGFLASERIGRSARWSLTESGAQLLADGTRRIYGFGSPDARWNGQWLVVLARVPEGERARRHRLRSQLEFAGFGFLGPGVAVSPHIDREQATNELLATLAPDAVVLVAETGSFAPDAEIIDRAWDLDGLAQAYREFVAAFAVRSPARGAERFVATVALVHEWRRFPFVDPEIPVELLPASWPGREAKAVFDERRREWSHDAFGWFDAVESTSN